MSVQQGESMREVWASWQGNVLNGTFPLHRWLGSSDHSGVFLTELTLRKSAQVAIKVVPAIAAFADAQLAQWSAAALLDHPHLIRILETGQCQFEGAPYLYVVMEYADQTLAELLPRRPLTEAEAREMLVPTLEALAFLHNRNLVLGQLKPANILAVGDQLKLASDTICSVSGGSGGHLGSVYDPPEARDGSSSTASDVWALGVTLFEALAQRPPSLDERRAGVAFPPEFPPAFRSIVTWCLSRRPYDRPKVAEIEAWVRREGDGAQPSADVASAGPDLEVPELQGAAVVAPSVAEPIEVEDIAAADAAGKDAGASAMGTADLSIAGYASTADDAPVPEGEGEDVQFELAPSEAPATIETSFFELDEAVVPDPDAFAPIEGRAHEGGAAPPAGPAHEAGGAPPAGVVPQGFAPASHSPGERADSQVRGTSARQSGTPSGASQTFASGSHATIKDHESQEPAPRGSHPSASVVPQAAPAAAPSAPEYRDSQVSGSRAASTSALVMPQAPATRAHSAGEHGDSQVPGSFAEPRAAPVVSQVSGTRAHSATDHGEPQALGLRAAHPMAEHGGSKMSGARVAPQAGPVGSQGPVAHAHLATDHGTPQVAGLRASHAPPAVSQAPGPRASYATTPNASQAAAPRASSATEHGKTEVPGSRTAPHVAPVVPQGSATRAHSAARHHESQARPPNASNASTQIPSQAAAPHARPVEHVESQAARMRVPPTPTPAMSQPPAPRAHSAGEHADSNASGSRGAGPAARVMPHASASRVPQTAQSTGPQAHALRAAQTPGSGPALSSASAQRAQSATESTGSHAALQRPHPTTGVNTPTHVTPQQSAALTTRTPAEVVRLTPPTGAAAPGAVTSDAVQKAQLARSGVEFVSQRLVYTIAGQEVSVPQPRNGSLLPLALIAAVLLALSWMGVRAIILHRDPPVVARVLPPDSQDATLGGGARESDPVDERAVSEPTGDADPTSASAAPTAAAVSGMRSGSSVAASVSGTTSTGPLASAISATTSIAPSVAAVSATGSTARTVPAVSGTRSAAPGLVAVSTSGAPAVDSIAPSAGGSGLSSGGGFRTAAARAGAVSGQASAPSISNDAAGSSSAIHEEIPDVPQRARRSIRGHVRVSVRVIVDRDGSVFAALVDEPGPSPYFARIALEAAKQWTFPPATPPQGVPVPDRRWEMVRFDFTREGTTGQAAPVE